MSKRETRALLFAIAIGLVAAASANAGLAALYSTPNDLPYPPQLASLHSTPNDLSELPYAEYFTTGINSSTPNEITTGKALRFANIQNLTSGNDNHLLDNTKSGTKSYVDNQGGGDYFANKGLFADNWANPIGGKLQSFKTAFYFSSPRLLDVRNNFVKTIPSTDKAKFDFIIDPNCNDCGNSIILTTTTENQIPITYIN